MRILLLSLAVATMGCSPRVAGHLAASDVVDEPDCTFDLTQPETLYGSLLHDDQPGIDCFTSDWNGSWELGFAHRDWSLKLTVPRRLHHAGEIIDLGSGTVGLVDARCAAWSGQVRWMSDEPAWSVFIDASCVDEPGRRIVGQLSGNP